MQGVALGYGSKNAGKPDTDIERALERATIASGGSLREKHRWLQDSINKGRIQRVKESQASEHQFISPQKRKKVLLLGSGMVAGPAVAEISRRTDVDLVIGMLLVFLSAGHFV